MTNKGGGKTRAFEEVRRLLLLRENVLVIAITFNHKWEYESGYIDNWSSVAEDVPLLSYALSVVSRMASVFFNQNFQEIVYFMKKQIKSLPEYYCINPDEFIRDFSTYIIERTSLQREIKTFIILADEVLKIEEGLQKKFKDSNLDFTTVLRSAILNNYFLVSSNNYKSINATLGISSLTDSPIGETNSGRAVIPLILPNRLNNTEIVNNIFEFNNYNDADTLLLRNVASTVDSIPRLVEFMRSFIKNQKLEQKEDIPLIIDNLFINNIFLFCAKQTDIRYKAMMNNLNNKVLSAIIFGDNLDLKEKETLDAIELSLISNSLSQFNRKFAVIEKVQTSIMMLWRATKSHDYELSLPGYIHRYNNSNSNSNNLS